MTDCALTSRTNSELRHNLRAFVGRVCHARLSRATMHRRQRLLIFATRRRNCGPIYPRLTAGVGVLVAFLLLGGSATVAVADPGRSHSDRGNSSDRGNDNGNARSGSVAATTTAAAATASWRGRRGRQRRTGQRRELRGSVRVGPCSTSPTSPSWRQASPQARAATGTDGADPGSSRVDVADVAESAPSIAAGSGELRSSEPGASVFGGSGSAGSSDRSGSYRADVPKRAVQSAALDGRQRAHARHPARRVRTAIAGPGTPTGARCAAACASTPGSSTAAVVDREPAPGGAGSHAATGCVSGGRLVGSVVGAHRAPPDPGRRRHSRIPAGTRRACGGQTTSFVNPYAGSCLTPTSG